MTRGDQWSLQDYRDLHSTDAVTRGNANRKWKELHARAFERAVKSTNEHNERTREGGK